MLGKLITVYRVSLKSVRYSVDSVCLSVGWVRRRISCSLYRTYSLHTVGVGIERRNKSWSIEPSDTRKGRTILRTTGPVPADSRR